MNGEVFAVRLVERTIGFVMLFGAACGRKRTWVFLPKCYRVVAMAVISETRDMCNVYLGKYSLVEYTTVTLQLIFYFNSTFSSTPSISQLNLYHDPYYA